MLLHWMHTRWSSGGVLAGAASGFLPACGGVEVSMVALVYHAQRAGRDAQAQEDGIPGIFSGIT